MEDTLNATYQASGTTCEGCANPGTKAIKTVAPGTIVEVSLEGKSVTVEGFGDATTIAAAFDDASFEFGGATAQWIKFNI